MSPELTEAMAGLGLPSQPDLARMRRERGVRLRSVMTHGPVLITDDGPEVLSQSLFFHPDRAGVLQ